MRKFQVVNQYEFREGRIQFALYTKIQRKGLVGFGNGLIDRAIQKNVPDMEGLQILEIGGGSGEHIEYVDRPFLWKRYEILDLHPGLSNPTLFSEFRRRGVVFTKGNIEEMRLDDEEFDLIISPCVLAHLTNPEKALNEMRRVIRKSGQIVIALPCDPGIMNRIIKFCVTFPKMKKLGILNPKLEYARDHRNSVYNLIVLIRHVFAHDKLNFRFYPFMISSWNLNLFVIAKIEVLAENDGTIQYGKTTCSL